jgi:hypothetical protein
VALVKQFDRQLLELWDRRSVYIKSLVRTHHGRQKSFTRRLRDNRILELAEVADAILTRRIAKKELAKVTIRTMRKHILGHGIESRYRRLSMWVDEEIDGPHIYSFWRGNRCLYVGKGGTGVRLKSYAKSIYLKEASLVKVWRIAGTSNLGKAECLARHLFAPRDNKIDPAIRPWSKSCPVCEAKWEVWYELRSLFRLK